MYMGIDVIIVDKLETDCLLGADFMRKFNAILRPRKATLSIKGEKKRIPLQLSSLEDYGAVAIHLDYDSLADVDGGQRERIQALLERLLPASDTRLGCTKWAERNIEITSSRPIKQKYYPVSRKLEGEMHEHVRKMLEVGIEVRSNSEWSSPVVMHRKSNGKYRSGIDFRKLNAITKACAYPLPQTDAILRKLQNARYISTLDLSSAYHQIPKPKEA